MSWCSGAQSTEDAPFLGLTQGEMDGGMHLTEPGPSSPQGWQRLFFPYMHS